MRIISSILLLLFVLINWNGGITYYMTGIIVYLGFTAIIRYKYKKSKQTIQ